MRSSSLLPSLQPVLQVQPGEPSGGADVLDGWGEVGAIEAAAGDVDVFCLRGDVLEGQVAAADRAMAAPCLCGGGVVGGLASQKPQPAFLEPGEVGEGSAGYFAAHGAMAKMHVLGGIRAFIAYISAQAAAAGQRWLGHGAILP